MTNPHPQEPREVMTAKQIEWIAERVTIRVCEIPDRDSPEDQPDMCLVTPKELHGIVADELETFVANAPAVSVDSGAKVLAREPTEEMLKAADVWTDLAPTQSLPTYGEICGTPPPRLPLPPRERRWWSGRRSRAKK